MKLNPQQAPLYGRCVITVQLADEELAGEEGVDYFLLFAGSTQRHLTSTLRSNHDTLQAVCPAHDCCEVVLVTLCSVSRGVPMTPEDLKPCLGRVAPLAEHRFNFVQDLAFDMAQFLVSTAGRADGLDGALLLDECQIPLQECERLDESLALALHHLTLPPGWSLLGRKLTNNTDPNPQETLLHFSARRGLFRVTHFLLQQSGAREALRLANRQGHTPSTIAALRGHERLRELLTKAETDTETDQGTETVQLVSKDAWIVCHLPRLNTHTLTLSNHPGHDPLTLQRSVEQLLHMICHLHAKGVSVLELQFDSLHTAAECCDGVETEITCLERLQQPSQASQCLDTTTGGNWDENCFVESSSSVDSGHGETGNAEKDWSLSVSTPASEVRPQVHGLGPPEDWVCPSSNTERDYCQTEEEGREQPVVSSQSLSLCDRSEGAQSEAEGESFTVGILPPAGCGKQAEETDRGEAVIREGEEATEGKDISGQEAEDSTAKRREEETNSESTDLITPSGDTKALVMGQTPSSESSNVSDTSDSEMKECCQEGENVEKEEMKLSQEHCDGLSLDEERAESKGLTDPSSTPGDLPNPSLMDYGDVIEEPESAVPRPSIEGLHEGEPPPDINSLEQNQETAGRDYATEQRGLAPETGCHSGNCTGTTSGKELDREDVAQPSGYSIESTTLPSSDEPDDIADCQTTGNSMEDIQTDPSLEPSPEMVPRSSNRQADLDLGITHGLSSDDDGSFQSVGSSTTEIFHPTQDNTCMVNPDLLQTKIAELSSTGLKMEGLNDSKPGENNEPDTGSELTVTDCCQTGTEPESQLSPSLQTMEALNIEGTGEEIAPELSNENLSLGPALLQSGDSLMVKVDESKPGEADDSELNAGIEYLASEVTSRVVFKPSPSVAEESDVINPLEGDHHKETSEKSAVNLAEKSGDVQLVPHQPKLDISERTADQTSLDEGLRGSENEINVSSSQGVTQLSDVNANVTNSEASIEPHVENESPETLDAVDGNSQSAIEELEAIMSEETVIAAGQKENGPTEEIDVSMIHRDREASFHLPCNAQHSGSSQSSASPSLPSRTSSATSCPSAAHRDSGSDIESLLNAEPGYDSIFRKNDEPVTGGDSASEVSVSCSSTDDTTSVGPSSSSPEGSQGLECSWSPEEGIQTGDTITAGLDSGGGEGGGGGAGEAEEEAKDRVTEVLRRSCLLRNSIRSLSPLRRHSWGPGKNNGGDAEMNQRSYSLEGLSGGQEELRGPTIQGPRILEPSRMPRHDSDDRGSLVSLTEEQEELGEHSRLHDLKSRRYRPLRNSCSPMTLPLTKSVSMLAISQRDIDGMRSFSSASGSLAHRSVQLCTYTLPGNSSFDFFTAAGTFYSPIKKLWRGSCKQSNGSPQNHYSVVKSYFQNVRTGKTCDCS
uniref:Si:dkey-172h23.2 n=1 Tax=Dicentrarchus labrax TaxID=13489 RepID=A0A8P4KFL0_DICLA